jgi:hypothetical protein
MSGSGGVDGVADADVVHGTTNSVPELDSAVATQSSNTLVDGLTINSSASLRHDELLQLRMANAALAAAAAFAPLDDASVAAGAAAVDDDASGSAVVTVDDDDGGDRAVAVIDTDDATVDHAVVVDEATVDNAFVDVATVDNTTADAVDATTTIDTNTTVDSSSTNAAALVENQAQAVDEDDDVVAVFVDNDDDDDDNDDVGFINHTDINADDATANNDVSNDVHAADLNGLVGDDDAPVGDVIGDNDDHDDDNDDKDDNNNNNNTNNTNNNINDDNDDGIDDVEVISSSSGKQRKRKGRTSPTSKKRKSQPVAAAAAALAAAAGEGDANDQGDEHVEASEDQHEVERVVGKRIGKGGRPEYKVKWVGWADKHNSWEPLDCLNCPNLITAYENELLRALEGGYALDALGKPMVGFAFNHTIASMLGAKFEGDDIYILCRWEGVSAYTFESSRVLREKVPMKLLDFYESRIRIADSTRLRRNPSDPMPAAAAAAAVVAAAAAAAAAAAPGAAAADAAAVGASVAEEGGAAAAAAAAGGVGEVAAAAVDGGELAVAGEVDGGDDSVAWHDPQVSHVQARLAPSLVASHLAALNNS